MLAAKAGARRYRSQSVRRILAETVSPRSDPNPPRILARQRDVAERTTRGAGGLLRRQAGLLQRLLLPGSVEINLFIELRFKLAMADEEQDAIQNGGHGLGSNGSRGFQGFQGFSYFAAQLIGSTRAARRAGTSAGRHRGADESDAGARQSDWIRQPVSSTR